MKTCILCSIQIKPKYKLCGKCYKTYKSSMHDPWFIELVLLERKQDKINRIEGYTLGYNTTVNMYGLLNTTTVSDKKNVGRPPTDWKLINEVLELYDSSVEEERLGIGTRLSLRKLQKKMDNRVKYLTIRKILLLYRYNIFQRRKQYK